jgi:predicted MPP superfamily phosphohydrolase
MTYHPPDYRPRLLHVVLVFSELLGRVEPLVITPAWLSLAAIACWPWDALRFPVVALSLALTITDGMGLALLPRRGRSFGPVTPPLLALTFVRVVLTFVFGLLWATRFGLLVIAVVHLAITAVVLYATWIEPFRIGVTHVELHSPKLDGYTPLRLLHVTDLHVERLALREQELLCLVEELAPDVIVLTGDYLNLSYTRDALAHAETRDLLARLCDHARGPVYAITGSSPVDFADVVPAIFEGLPITWLLDETAELNVKGHVVHLVGLRCTQERSLDVPRLRRLLDGDREQKFTLLLYHSPDLMPEAVELGVDLYLCGPAQPAKLRRVLPGSLLNMNVG